MYVPNRVKVFGSQYITIRVGVHHRSYHQIMTISKSHLKALDQPSEHCAEDTKLLNVSACIAKFIEGQLGCSAKIQGSGSPQKIPCNNVTQLKTMSQKFQEADANKIYRTTGCLASCEKDEYHKIDGTKTDSLTAPFDIQLEFRIMEGSYQEMEQYLLYDFDSFIADVGGFMGLLLGFSVLSIYNGIMDLLKDKCKLVWNFGKIQARGNQREETDMFGNKCVKHRSMANKSIAHK